MYRNRPGVLALTCALSVAVHVMNTVGIYCIARWLPGDVPSLGAHFIIVSLGMLAGAVPLLPGGLGAFELTMNELYRLVPGGAEVARDEGLLVAFGFRAVTITIAIVGLVYYFRSRRDIDAAWAEAEHLDDEQDDAAENAAPASSAKSLTAAPARGDGLIR